MTTNNIYWGCRTILPAKNLPKLSLGSNDKLHAYTTSLAVARDNIYRQTSGKLSEPQRSDSNCADRARGQGSVYIRLGHKLYLHL